ncbi:MAG: IclR family transcriptional regulator [Usitatibacter sp.]
MRRKVDRITPSVRALAILEAIVAEEHPASLTEIAARSGLPPPTAHRLLAQLESAGWARREPGGKRFGIGARLSPLALRALTHSGEAATRRAILERLVVETRETCNLTMVDRGAVVYVDRVESAWPLRLTFRSGARVPLHCTASGKLLLALMPAAKRERLLTNLGFERHTANTITDRRALEADLKRIRRRRVGVDNEEFVTGLLCVAVPVPIDEGQSFAAVAIQAPVARMTLEQAMAQLPALERAAADLAQTFAAA